jgi:hypothetical protein
MVRVAAAGFVLVLLAGCESHPAASVLPTPSGQVIPWTPLTPNLTPPPAPLGPAPIAPGTLPCQASDLLAVVIGSNGATGHVLTSFGFAGAGSASCFLDGTPSVGLVDSDGHLIGVNQRAPYMPPRQPGRSLVSPGPFPTPYTALSVGQASLTIDWGSQPEPCSGAPAVIPAKALIAIPAGGILSIAIPPEPAIFACQGLGVGAFEGPYVAIQPSPQPPLPAIGMQVPSSGHVGTALPYFLTLTADRNQPFDFAATCPTYEEELFADLSKGSPPLGGKHIYELNCQPAGSLPAGASITFQMVFLVPLDAAPGRYTLTFALGYWNAMTSYAQAQVTIRR